MSWLLPLARETLLPLKRRPMLAFGVTLLADLIFGLKTLTDLTLLLHVCVLTIGLLVSAKCSMALFVGAWLAANVLQSFGRDVGTRVVDTASRIGFVLSGPVAKRGRWWSL